jgi:Ankyrin repeat
MYQYFNWTGIDITETAFHKALRHSPPSLISLFITHGADPNIPISSNTSSMRSHRGSKQFPIHFFCDGEKLKLVERLLDAGANVCTLSRG